MKQENGRTIDVALRTQAQRPAKDLAHVRLLCATDLSPRSQRAVTRAVLLANQLNAKLILLHVETRAAINGVACARREIARQLSSSRGQVRRKPEIRVEAGEYLSTIADVAQEADAQLVLLGSQQRKSPAPLIGSTAEYLMGVAPRPVLIVNRDPQLRYSGVVVAAELSAAFSRVIRSASCLRLLEDASVAVVHGLESAYRGPLYAAGFDQRAATRNIEEWERAARSRLQQNLDAAGVKSAGFRLVFQQSQPIRAIQRVVRSIRPDLLIVGTKNRSMLDRLMRGSGSNDALRSVECDILVASSATEVAVPVSH
jgi:nucleotide-binding universal stress UspA family protein